MGLDKGGWTPKIFRAVEVCDRAITRTDIGKNDVLTVLLYSHGLVDEF